MPRDAHDQVHGAIPDAGSAEATNGNYLHAPARERCYHPAMIREATIETLGAQGDGVTADGIFVPGTLPGEQARIDANGHRARLIEVTHEATERVAPICTHYDNCGGCTLQHASDGLLAGWKQDLVHRALSARGITGVAVRPIHVSPPHSRRRVTLSARRTKRDVVVGFHPTASDAITPITACPIAAPEVSSILPALAELTRTGASRKGTLRITVTTSEEGLDVSVDGGKPIEGPLYGQLVAVAATADLARLSWNGETVVTRRPPYQRMGRARVLPPPGGFLQATRDAEDALVGAMREATDGCKRIADLFCGSGTFTLPLAETAEVLAIESEIEALEALDAGWRQADGLRRVRTAQRDLFHRPLLAREFKGLDGVVFDPPRQGARSQTEHLAQSDVPRIGAVSCNPATFARDARTLIDAGFVLDWVQPVDQFRWSPHVELAAAFSRK